MRAGVAIDVQTQIAARSRVKHANGHLVGVHAAGLLPTLMHVAGCRQQAGDGSAQLSFTPRCGPMKCGRVRHGALSARMRLGKNKTTTTG